MNDAVIVTGVGVETGDVATANETVVPPAGTLTLGGKNTALALLDDRRTVVFAAAGALSVTVPVAELPPVAEDGTTLTERTEIVAIVRTPRPSYA